MRELPILQSQLIFVSLQYIETDAFACQLKLHPGIVYSHPATAVCFPPRLQYHAGAEGRPTSFLSSLIQSGRKDWGYAFDLCGSLYRLKDVEMILDQAKSDSDFANPNILEVFGNLVFREFPYFRKYDRLLSCSRHVLSVLTVNRVQTVFDVPVYHCDSGTLVNLNNLLLLPDSDCHLNSSSSGGSGGSSSGGGSGGSGGSSSGGGGGGSSGGGSSGGSSSGGGSGGGGGGGGDCTSSSGSSGRKSQHCPNTLDFKRYHNVLNLSVHVGQLFFHENAQVKSEEERIPIYGSILTPGVLPQPAIDHDRSAFLHSRYLFR